MPSAPVYPVVPHHLQHFLQEHALPGHIYQKHPAIVVFHQITALFLHALYLALFVFGYMLALFSDICVSIFLLLRQVL